MENVKIVVQGKVQGVGFRYHTKTLADQIGILGTVENQSDGSVLIYASSNKEDLQTFVSQLKNKKPSFAIIDDVTVTTENDLPDYNSFKIVYP